MGLEQELINLMLETVTLEPRTGLDKFAKPTYGAAVIAQCKIVKMNKKVISKDGSEMTSTVQVYLANPLLPVTLDSRLTLPGTTDHPAIIELIAAYDDEGPYLLEIRA